MVIIERGDEGAGRVRIDLFTTQTVVAYLQDGHSDSSPGIPTLVECLPTLN